MNSILGIFAYAHTNLRIACLFFIHESWLFCVCHITPIHNPTLQLMHKWLTITLFPRDDVRTVCNDELLILYAMVNKIKITPAQALVVGIDLLVCLAG